METFKNVLARVIVRAIRWAEGPQPRLMSSQRRYSFHRGHIYDDYASKARTSYGDDQY